MVPNRRSKIQHLTFPSNLELDQISKKFNIPIDIIKERCNFLFSHGQKNRKKIDIFEKLPVDIYLTINISDTFPVNNEIICETLPSDVFIINTSPEINIKKYNLYLECGRCSSMEATSDLLVASASNLNKKICILSDSKEINITESFLSGSIRNGKIYREDQNYSVVKDDEYHDFIQIVGGDVPLIINKTCFLDCYSMPKSFDPLRNTIITAMCIDHILVSYHSSL